MNLIRKLSAVHFAAVSLSLTMALSADVTYIDEDGTEQLCTSYTVLTSAAGDVELVARRLVLASDVAPLKASYDSIMVCNGYLVLRIGTDLSVP